MAAGKPVAATDISTETVRKVRNRLIPLLFLLYIVAFLDRINIGFAALTMNADLGLTSAQFGFLTGIFFWGYCLFEIPSNVLLHRIGARTWIARILVSWGIVAVLTGFVHNTRQLYVARFLLGVAEAGFFPGILLYLTYWFRKREQARMIAFVHGRNSRLEHHRSAGFRLHPRSCPLVGAAELEMAPGFRGTACDCWRAGHLVSPAKPSCGGSLSFRPGEALDCYGDCGGRVPEDW